MRNKIDYGIDLGTTNSAIARMENGVPIIKKSDTLKDTIPSCVHFNKRQDILIGDAAFNVMKNDNTRALKTFEKGKTNTFIEFKRTMGTTHTYECSNMNKSFSSEELSSEVLKKLKSFIQDENISSIVITVPAKFLNPQNEATMKAAQLAGFKHVELLQEPVAAATAYGLGSKTKDGYWLVFDFGGGTFDAALVKAEEGILSVKDTDGDNWLGGKNLDEAIVDQIIIPNLREKYSIEGILEDAVKKQILREAVKPFAEEIKIEMSFKDSCNYISPLGSLPFEDENGEEPEIEVSLTQSDLELVVAPIFQKAIDITKALIKRNNISESDIDALILVGGPTYSPILRRMLKDQITNKVDTSVDPMTVVAKGAALFASTISLTEEVKDSTRDRAKIQLDLKYKATSVELDELINVKILKDKTEGEIPEKVYVDFVRSGGDWSSNKQLIGEKSSLIEVLLLEGRSNNFEIHLYDEQGNKLESQPNQFSILQGIGGLDGMQVLPYFIGIGKYFHTEKKDLFYPVKGLEKSKKVPATGVLNNLKTRVALRPGIATDVIKIPIYQGDYDAIGTNPLLNNLINEVVITGEDLPALLPEGSDVDLTIKVDRSQLMHCSVYFPLLNHTEDVKIEIKQTEPPSEDKLYTEINKASKEATKVQAEEITNELENLKSNLDNEKGSADGKMKILDGLRKQLLKLDSATKAAEWPTVEQELKDAFFDFEDLLNKIKNNSDNDKISNFEKMESHLNEYRNKVDHIILEKDIRQAKELTEDINMIDRELRNALTQGSYDVRRIEYHDESFEEIRWKDKTKARQLVNQGLQLIADGKTNQLRPVLIKIWEQRIDDDEEMTGTLG